MDPPEDPFIPGTRSLQGIKLEVVIIMSSIPLSSSQKNKQTKHNLLSQKDTDPTGNHGTAFLPAGARHTALALWLSLHSPVPSPQAPCLSSCNRSFQSQPPELPACEQDHLEMPSLCSTLGYVQSPSWASGSALMSPSINQSSCSERIQLFQDGKVH